MDIAKILKERRIELDITQDDLAKHLGYDNRSTLHRLETGQTRWKFDNVIKAARLLMLDIEIKEL